MSTLKVGDKVKFLNASGGGIVAKIIDSRMVSILIEDGFEIPTMISELIRIEPDEPAARFFEEHYNIDVPVQSGDETEPGDERMTRLPAHLVSGRKSEDIFLAFVPHDQKWLITGQVDIFLINNSSLDILYNIFTRTPIGHFDGIDYGSVFPGSKLLITTINREQLTHWTDGCIQFLFHKDQSRYVLPPFNSEFAIDGKRFFKEGNYRDNALVQGRGIVIKLLSLSEHFRAEEESLPDTGKSTSLPNEDELFITRYKVAPGEAIVDLHIHALVDDPTYLDKSEILEFQKNYFLRCLDSAVAGHYFKVVFIHGIGNGTLRASLTELLKKQEGIGFSDSPLTKYGSGALEIRIPYNDHAIL